jgi:NAD(P)-dependent dehydrogenase (short-subunit alcohol dehydrogenase family)
VPATVNFNPSALPGWIETAAYHSGQFAEPHSAADELQHPAGRVGVPEDIANMAMFLCDEDNDFITGQNFTVDGGMTKKMIYTGDEGWRLTL